MPRTVVKIYNSDGCIMTIGNRWRSAKFGESMSNGTMKIDIFEYKDGEEGSCIDQEFLLLTPGTFAREFVEGEV